MRKLKVMVVDDSNITIKKLAKMLEDIGHEVVCTANTGQQAVESYAQCAPDIVTMDITMPDMDGIEATKKILAVAPEALIVVVTSHGQEQMVIDAIDAGAKGYLLKPVKSDKLAQHLGDIVEKYLP